MRIKLKRTRNFTPPEERRITVKYREGEEYTVKRTWGEAMVKDGDAVEVKEHRKAEAEADGEA